MKFIGYVLITLAAVLGVSALALCLTIVGIIPGIGMLALSGLLMIYGVAAARGERMRGALSRRRETKHSV